MSIGEVKNFGRSTDWQWKNLLRSVETQEVLGWEMILPDQPYTVTVRTSEARSSPYSVIKEITISAVPGAWAVRLR